MRIWFIAALLSLTAPERLWAADPCPGEPCREPSPGGKAAGPSARPWRLGLAFGYGARTDPLIQADSIPLLVDVDVAWFGDRWFFDNGDLGFTFADNDRLTASVTARLNSDRIFFGRAESRFVRFSADGQTLSEVTLLSVPERNYAVEAGLEILTDGRWGALQVTAHHDVSGTHGGYEVFLDYRFGWRGRRWYVAPSLGMAFKSSALNDYYWGVDPEEANAALPARSVGSGINAHGRLVVSYQLTRHWALSVAAEYERLSDTIVASPIVSDRGVIGYFAGVGYHF